MLRSGRVTYDAMPHTDADSSPAHPTAEDTATMRAVVLRTEGAPDVLHVETSPLPHPGNGEVRIRVHAAAINHLDLWIRKGMPSVPKPRIMGADGAGVIDAVGVGVDPKLVGSKVVIDPSITCGRCRACMAGNTVYCDTFSVLGEHRAGTHAEYVVVPDVNVHPVPAHMSMMDAAALPLAFATAWRMIMHRAQARPGERMLIWGASAGVGCAAVQIGAAYGLETIVTSRSADKLATLRELGATHTIDSSTDDVVSRVRALTDGAGVEIVFDHLGDVSWKPSMTVLAKGGRFVTCGATTGPNPGAQITRIFWKGLSVLGSTMASKQDVRDMLRFVDVHRITPHVDRIFPLEDIAAAHAHVESSSQVGKVVLSIAP